MNLERNECPQARERLVMALLEGRTFQAVREGADVPLKRAMVYRFLHAVRTQVSVSQINGVRAAPAVGNDRGNQKQGGKKRRVQKLRTSNHTSHMDGVSCFVSRGQLFYF